MWNYFTRGGPIMWPLLVLSVLGITVAIWRALVLWRVRRETPVFLAALRPALLAGDVAAARDICDRSPGPVASIVKAGLVKFGRSHEEVERSLQDASAHELSHLEKGLPTLATVAMIAPLLGFLGTVTGMINSFEALASVGLNNPAAVANGISEALITTAAGLMIAIPIQMAYNYFVTEVNAQVRNMEAAANLVLEALGDVRATTPERRTAPALAPATA